MRAVAETASTNADMLALAEAGEMEGLWLRADVQHGGRGRQGRIWQSPAGNLYASTLVRPMAGDPSPPTLALVASVALEQVASGWLGERRVVIKWPNDLLVGGGKLSGILLEARQGAVVVGFGLNLAHHPLDVDRPATDIVTAGGPLVSADDAMAALASAFAEWLAIWRREGLVPVRARWLERAHPMGTPLVARGGDGSERLGSFGGLDESGALILRRADGGEDRIQAGEVFLL